MALRAPEAGRVRDVMVNTIGYLATYGKIILQTKNSVMIMN